MPALSFSLKYSFNCTKLAAKPVIIQSVSLVSVQAFLNKSAKPGKTLQA